jgi:AraC-like DNA-binding protein
MGELFYLGSIFCAFLTIYILIFKENAIRSYADYILSAYFIFQIWCATIYLLIYSGWIINVPHVYKTAAPINFLLPPLSFLYVRAILFNEKKFTLKDILHFIPFFIFFINYMPFFLMNTRDKSIIVEATTKNLLLAYQYKAGLLPEYIGYILRPIQVAIYLFFQWKLIIKFRKSYASNSIEKQVKDVLKWLKVFSWSSTIFLIGFVLLVIIAILSSNLFALGLISIIPGIIISLSFFVISIYLLVHPEITIGLPFIQYKEIESVLVADLTDKIPFIRDNYDKEIEKIETYFTEKEPFLINNISIIQISVILNIPVRELSYIINNHYKMRFNDFLNSYRIEHIIKMFNSNMLDNYTLESISKQAGFSSKSSFYRAFHKIHNCTPVEYIQNLNR